MSSFSIRYYIVQDQNIVANSDAARITVLHNLGGACFATVMPFTVHCSNADCGFTCPEVRLNGQKAIARLVSTRGRSFPLTRRALSESCSKSLFCIVHQQSKPENDGSDGPLLLWSRAIPALSKSITMDWK